MRHLPLPDHFPDATRTGSGDVISPPEKFCRTICAESSITSTCRGRHTTSLGRDVHIVGLPPSETKRREEAGRLSALYEHQRSWSVLVFYCILFCSWYGQIACTILETALKAGFADFAYWAGSWRRWVTYPPHNRLDACCLYRLLSGEASPVRDIRYLEW